MCIAELGDQQPFICVALKLTLHFMLVLGILLLAHSASVWRTANFTLAFYCFTLILNILATILIVGRLLFFRARLSKVLSPSHASQYTGIITLIVESEMLYTVYLVLTIVLFACNQPVANVFIQGASSVQVRLRFDVT